MKEQQIKAKITGVFKDNGTITTNEEFTEVIGAVRLDENLAYATISTDRKYTKGLPSYSSASAGVFVSVPCLLNEEDMENAYKFVSDFAEKKLAEKIKELSGGAK